MCSFALRTRFGFAPAAAPSDTFRGAFWCSSSRRHQSDEDSERVSPHKRGSITTGPFSWLRPSRCTLGYAPGCTSVLLLTTRAAWTAVRLDITQRRPLQYLKALEYGLEGVADASSPQQCAFFYFLLPYSTLGFYIIVPSSSRAWAHCPLLAPSSSIVTPHSHYLMHAGSPRAIAQGPPTGMKTCRGTREVSRADTV
ncbi:hypothetical protein BDZ89DRAFT_418386 [Hymenopellis radicata]|nr:hypothetical protein BDZ89DRAFT_418386 [Hymenopellis radicata]